MALRKGSAYSHRHARPYTRKSKVKQKSYIKAVPNSKIVKFRMGDIKGYLAGKYPIVMDVQSKEQLQLRDNSIESVRQFLNRFLLEKIGKEFYFEVKVYPHHILRENKMITGAGADRMQTGMSQSFGRTMGRAALIKPGKTIFIVAVLNERHEAEARKLIGSARARISCKLHIETTKAKKVVA